MKIHLIAAAALTSLFLSSCATNQIQKRISNNLDIYSELSTEDQNLVQSGQIKKGMPKKAVFIAWGNPSRSAKGQNQSGPFEKWYYYQHSPRTTGGIYGGYGYYGYDHYGIGVNRGTSYDTELIAQVEFRNERVISWENSRNPRR
ncbi:hypothetical protein [Rubritalea marina]|uniref:hypothetical protein n=1 Tax=Rubritalea marina TaxID=361055 RepID=UPI0003A0CA19|nr:hypothetical protein [Rubritalea marina]